MALSGHLMQCGIMSAFGGKADIKHYPAECPLMTHSGHKKPVIFSLYPPSFTLPLQQIDQSTNELCRRITLANLKNGLSLGATVHLLGENDMYKLWKLFALVVSVGFIGQPAAAGTKHPMKCHIQVELTEAAEMQLGGALYSGPKLGIVRVNRLEPPGEVS